MEKLDFHEGLTHPLLDHAPWLRKGRWESVREEVRIWVSDGPDGARVAVLIGGHVRDLRPIAQAADGRPCLALRVPGPDEGHVAFEARHGRERSTGAAETLCGVIGAAGTHLEAVAHALDCQARVPIQERFFRDVDRQRDAIHAAWRGVSDDAARAHLTLLLVTRLLFLHYLQERGWFGEACDYLERLLLHPDATRLYRSRVRPLFLDALNRPVDERTSGPLFEGLPFLNGGLFCEDPEEIANPDADLPDEVVRDLMRTVFLRYLFDAADTDTSGGAGVRPEMLGTLFERWMSRGTRQRSGAYYTPPNLVADLCEALLDPMLRERLGNTVMDWAADEPDALLSVEAAEAALHRLDSLRVLDPAVGTGAFLLHVVERMAELRLRLVRRATPSVDYRARLADQIRFVVQHLVCGIDLSRTAVHLCTLRIWLAYVSELPSDSVPTLPNLQHRIRHGDSLATGTDIGAHERIALPEALIESYHDASHRYAVSCGRAKMDAEREMIQLETWIGEKLATAKLARLTERIEDAERSYRAQGALFAMEEHEPTELGELLKRRDQLLSHVRSAQREGWAALFDPHVHFAPIMQRGGFDLVLGNPPWIRLAALPPDRRAYVSRTYRWMRSSGEPFGSQPDVSIAFFERAVSLARPGGWVALLVPSKLLNAGYGRTLRTRLRADTDVREIIDLRDDVVGFRASVYPTFIVASKRSARRVSSRVTIRRLLPADRWGAPRDHRFRLSVNWLGATEDPRDPWPLIEADLAVALRDLLKFPALASTYAPKLGIKTGLNRAYLGIEPRSVATCPCVRGADIRPMHAEPSDRILLPHDPTTGTPWPSLPEELEGWFAAHASDLHRRSDARGRAHPPWRVFRIDAGALAHRVVWRDLSRLLQAAPLAPVDVGGPVHLNSCYALHVESEIHARVLSLWLNTLPCRFVAWSLAEPAAGGYRRYMATNVGRVPLPTALLDTNGWAFSRMDVLAESLLADPKDHRAYSLADELACEFLGVDPRLADRMRETLGERRVPTYH